MAWHSEKGSSYHFCENCPHGKRIKPENRRDGTENKQRCSICHIQYNSGPEVCREA